MEGNYIWPEITEDTTLEEVRKIHKRIWNYVIEHGEKPYTPYRFDCVLCEYAAFRLRESNPEQPCYGKCSLCPAIWNDETCEDSGSVYREWKAYTQDASLARKVRDIPFKEE